ncbi:MAG: sn-glycerol-3-phosphate ABC transporter ATP-binding protein UgpC [Planctomycetaceae bacterium]|nr:sn-glycerol-3-phosphate ABC transporter ATP-binding protein UgpC [Planctomycetaceae bacterium]
MAQVGIRKIEKTYPNGFKAVHGIDLEINDGEFMVLVGPSGCGKSTLLRMIAGLETITGGQLVIGDKVVNNMSPKQRGIAMVFQNYALYPHMKIFDNLAFGLKLSKLPKSDISERVNNAAKLLEIEPLLDRLPRQLSGGQAQRVALGRALVKRPEVFLFDEPLSNLDAKLRASMRVRITTLHENLRESGAPSTVVYVTHDQTEAMTMGERICVMKDGRIMQVDRPPVLYSRPANTFVAGFIGSPEMNIRSAQVVQAGSGLALTFGGATVPLPQRMAAKLKSYVDRHVLFGIRPEDFGVRETHGDDASHGAFVPGKIKLIEHMGSELYIYFDVGGVEFTCRIRLEGLSSTATLGRGDVCDFFFIMDRCHVFDKDSGDNLTLE